MVTVGITLMFSVFDYFREDFNGQMADGFSDSIMRELEANLSGDDFAKKDKELLSAYSGVFGFDSTGGNSAGDNSSRGALAVFSA